MDLNHFPTTDAEKAAYAAYVRTLGRHDYMQARIQAHQAWEAIKAMPWGEERNRASLAVLDAQGLLDAEDKHRRPAREAALQRAAAAFAAGRAV